MYAQLGTIQFLLIMPIGMDSSRAYSYAEHQVIEGKPLLQYVGDGLEVYNIQCRFHFSFCSPHHEIERLKAEADKHQALPLIFKNGDIKGHYVITDLATTTEITADDGTLMSADVRITLKEWVDTDPLGSRESAKKQSAPGNQAKGPIALPTAAPGNRTAVISGQIITKATQIKQSAAAIATDAATLKSRFPALSAVGDQLRTLSGSVSTAIDPIMQQARNLGAMTSQASNEISAQTSAISGYSSNMTHILSGLPGPAGQLGARMAAYNNRISAQSNQITTLSALANGQSAEIQTRAGMITRLFPK